MKGLFITLEGTDGAGKTTQCNVIKNYFENINKEVLLLREPGGTKIGEQIRNIIVSNNNTEMSFYTEALLYAASRAQLVHQVINPALKEGKIVVCDRFLDSSIVYQGIARGIGIKEVENINNIAIDGLAPNLTFFLDIKPNTSIKRKNNCELDRLEQESQEFFNLVYNGYKTLCELYSNRIIRIDATENIDAVSKSIIDSIEYYLSIKGEY